MLSRQPEALTRVALEIELDEHSGFISRDPPVVPRLDRNGCWRGEFLYAAIGISDADLTMNDETDVRMHAKIRADISLHVR